jgi:DNA-binding NtrC family response regulator
LPEDLLKNQTAQKVKNESSLTHEQSDYILKNGLNEFIKSIEKQITTKVFQMNEGKIRPTLKTLQISSTTLYRILNESGINLKEKSESMNDK